MHPVREAMIGTGFDVQPPWAGGALLFLTPVDAAAAEMLVATEVGKPLTRNCVLVSEEFESLIDVALDTLSYRKRPRARQDSRLAFEFRTDHTGVQAGKARPDECDQASGSDLKIDKQQTAAAWVSPQPIAACVVELQSRIVLKNSFLHLRSGRSENSEFTKSTGDRMQPRWKNPRSVRWTP